MNKKIVHLIALSILMLFQNAFAQDNSALSNTKNPVTYVISVPAGVKTTALLAQDINSDTAVVGQTIEAILTENFTYNNKIIAPSGSVISGSVVSNKKIGTDKQKTKMQIRFTTIRTPYNNLIPVSALIVNEKAQNAKVLIPAADTINIKFDQPITLGAN